MTDLFIKRKQGFDVRGVKGFRLVLVRVSETPLSISLTHLEFSLVMLKESMNPK